MVTPFASRKIRDSGSEAAGRRFSSRPSRPWVAFALLSGGRFMVMLDLMIVVLALPAAQSAFKVAPSATQWALSIYALSFGGFLLLAGKAGDLFGRRRILVAGLATFSVASLLGGLAPSMSWFIAARAIQGLGAAMISPTAFAAVTTLFAEVRLRARAIAIWSALSGVAFPVGALVGGLLVAGPGWRWVMFVNVPIGLLCCLLAPVLLADDGRAKEAGAAGDPAADAGNANLARERLPARSGRLDLGGSTTATFGLIALVWVLSEGNLMGWLSPSIVAAALLAVALLAAFVTVEKRAEEPVIRLDLLRDRSLVGANLSTMLGQAGFTSCLFGLSFFLQHSLRLNPVTSGLAFLPTSLVFIFATNMSPWLATRLGARLLVVCGSISMGGGFFLYSRMSPGGIDGPFGASGFLLLFLGGSLLVGLFGVALPVLFTAGVAGVPPEHRGTASGLLNTSQQIGSALGLAIATIVASAAGPVRATGAIGAAIAGGATGAPVAGSAAAAARHVPTPAIGSPQGFVACAVLMAIGAAAAIVLIRGRSRKAESAAV